MIAIKERQKRKSAGEQLCMVFAERELLIQKYQRELQDVQLRMDVLLEVAAQDDLSRN